MNIWLAISHKTKQVISIGISDASLFYMAVRMDLPKGMYASGMTDVHAWVCRTNAGPLNWDILFHEMIDNKDLRFGELRL